MKKFLILILMMVSIVGFAYDSCPCPDGDPGHVDHVQTEQAVNDCLVASEGKRSYESCKAEAEAKAAFQIGAG